MKKTILCILLLMLFADVCYAGSPIQAVIARRNSSATENMCTDGDSDILCETFDTASGYDNSWTEVTGGTSAINPDSANVGNFYCDTSTESLSLTRGDTDVSVKYVFASSSTTSVYALFYVKMDSIGSLTTTGRLMASIIRSDDTANTMAINIKIGSDANHYTLSFSHRDVEEALISTAAAVDLTMGVWHQVEIFWLWNTDPGVSVTVDGTKYTPSAGNTETSDNVGYKSSGFTLSAITVPYTIGFDNIKIDGTAAPACVD